MWQNYWACNTRLVSHHTRTRGYQEGDLEHTTTDRNHCTLRAIHYENGPPSNRLSPLCRKIWEPHCLRCWWEIGRKWHPPHAHVEEGDQRKPRMGPTSWLNHRLSTQISRRVITCICNHHNVQKWCHNEYILHVARAGITWQHHQIVQRNYSVNNKAQWNT